MPIEGIPLVIEPTFPGGKELAGIGQKPSEPLPDGIVQRNCFYSRKKRCDIYIWNEPDGSLLWGLVPAFHGFTHALTTLGASDAWGIAQESKALELLGTLVSHRQMKHYLLTGMFMETSKRSGLTYVFRKLRPTVVIDIRHGENATPNYDIGQTESGKHEVGARILCALCMHPLAYYSGSWAGAMTPTDDVVAHLMLMRGDEPMLWRRANQHAPHRPEAGL